MKLVNSIARKRKIRINKDIKSIILSETTEPNDFEKLI
jgi:RNase P subunit RPR2